MTLDEIGSRRGSSTDREMFFVCVRRPKDTAYFQHRSLHALCVDTNRDPRPRVCAVLDWDSILCPVSHCYDQKCLAYDHHQMRSQPPWPQVHFPRHARSQILYFLPVLCPRCWNLLVSCTRNIFWFLPASNVAQSHISGHRIRHLAGPGPGPLCSHLLSTQTCCHLTHFLFTQIAAAVTLRTAILVTASLVLIKFQFQFYYRAVISHSYREHIAIVKLAAENIRVNKIYGMFVAFNITVFEPTFITLSYMQIFITVFWFPQKEARLKALNTCIAHICDFLRFYLLGFFSFFAHRFGSHIPPYIHILFSVGSSISQSTCLWSKTKQICIHRVKMFCL